MNRHLRIASRAKLRLTLAVALVVALVSAVGAFAYVSSPGTGSGSADAGTLNPPTNVTVPTSSKGTTHVAWTASDTGPDAVAPTGYFAERNAGGPAWTPACDSSPSALVSTTDCDDTVSIDGDYTYRVTAVYHSWTATSDTSSSVHVVTDWTPPTSTISFPGAGPYSETAWNAGCATPGSGDICGSANDPGAGASGVAEVQVSIERLSDGGYWNGGSWSAGPTWNDATGTTSWSYALGTGNLDDGSYIVHSRAIDNATNTQTTPDSTTFAYDATAPSVTVERTAGQSDLTNSLPMRWAVSFSEPVTGFDASDLTRGGTSTGGTVSVSGSGASYEISLGGATTDGTVSFSIDADRAQDAAGNGNTSSTVADNAVAYDATAPSVTVEQEAGQSDPTNSLPLRWAVTFSEPVTGFDAGDLTRGGTSTGGTVSVTGSGASYEITLDSSPTNGTVRFSLGAGWAHDTAGNGNSASTSVDNAITYDSVAPSLTVQQKAGQADPTNSLPLRFTALFSEPVADFDNSDVSLGGTAGGGSVTVTGSGRTYEIAVSGLSGDGTVTASVGAGKAHDAAGNASSASTSTDNSVTYDATAPSVTVEQKVGQADPTRVLPMQWTVSFSEAVTGFDAGDLSRSGSSTGGTVNVTGSGSSYEIALSGTPTNGTVSFSVGANRAQDAAGNTNTASTSSDNTVLYDTVAPATTIALSPGAPNGSNGWYRTAPTFTLGASDAGSGVASTVYTIDAGSPQAYSGAVTVPDGQHTVSYWSTDNAGNVEATHTRSVKVDTVAPVDALSLAASPAAAGAFLAPDNTLFYKGDAPGWFTLIDSPTDGTSGIAFMTFPSTGTFGWLGAGGPDAFAPFSAGYSWGSIHSNPGPKTVTSFDAAGNASAGTTVTFVSDVTAPGDGALTVNGTAASGSGTTSTSSSPGFAIDSRTDFGESASATASGLRDSKLTVQSAPIRFGSCGLPGSGGPFTSATEISGTTQPAGIVSGYCYVYRLTGTDNVGNDASVSTVVKVVNA